MLDEKFWKEVAETVSKVESNHVLYLSLERGSHIAFVGWLNDTPAYEPHVVIRIFERKET